MQQVVGNWKLNGDRQLASQGLDRLAQAGPHNTSVCVPTPYLSLACETVASSSIQIGAQDVSQYTQGAYTGEVSAKMLAEMGAQFTLIGHSERRKYFAETNAVLAKKIEQAATANLFIIFCVGEDSIARHSGTTIDTVRNMLKPLKDTKVTHFAIAYEPVWAIGSGVTPTLAEISRVHEAIKTELQSTPVLYGGSVNLHNATEILSIKEVDGVLVGGASLNIEEFIKISHCAMH